MSEPEYEKYYVPAESPWPFLGAVALFLIAVGAGNFVIESTSDKEGFGLYVLLAGLATLIFMLFGWFRNQIHESMSGLYSQVMGWFGLPLVNTIILLSSSVTCHIAHVALEENKRGKLKVFLGITVLLGAIFMGLQVEEYIHAYSELGLTLESGIYGNTFFLLTGFHGFHVTLGAIILFIMLLRIMKGHFTPEDHFAFQAGSWYWHFVDVVWVILFFFVYII